MPFATITSLKQILTKSMKFKQAADYFTHGIIASFAAIRDPEQSDRWLLEIISTNKSACILHNDRNKKKSFSSLDSLVKEVERIAGTVEILAINMSAKNK